MDTYEYADPASSDDNDVLSEEHAQYMYNLVKNTPEGTPNGNVSLMEFETPVSALISEIVGRKIISCDSRLKCSKHGSL